MSAAIEQALAALISGHACCIGEIAINPTGNRFLLAHLDDFEKDGLVTTENPADAIRLAMFDDAGDFRPLKTAPNLRHGWRMELADVARVVSALEYFYPGRLAALVAWKQNRLKTTPLRETLDRQSGMYRVAARISDEQIDDVVGNFCRSDGGCLRTILWKRDAGGVAASRNLPPEKFDPADDQTGHKERSVPLLCQEACNLLVAECRKAVKGETAE